MRCGTCARTCRRHEGATTFLSCAGMTAIAKTTRCSSRPCAGRLQNRVACEYAHTSPRLGQKFHGPLLFSKYVRRAASRHAGRCLALRRRIRKYFFYVSGLKCVVRHIIWYMNCRLQTDPSVHREDIDSAGRCVTTTRREFSTPDRDQNPTSPWFDKHFLRVHRSHLR